MGSWGNCNFDDFIKFRDNLSKFTEKEYDRLAQECCNEIAARLLGKVIRKTTVSTGYLKRSWNVNSAMKRGGEWRATVYNPTKYAIYVEYGHRTSNHSGWVKGQFMLTKSEYEIEKIMPKLLEQHILRKLGEIFG